MLTVFGDSISHGGADGGWPIRIRQRMRHIGKGDEVYVQAVPGNTSFDLVKRMPIELPLRKAEAILIAVGTNDAQILHEEAYPRVTDEEFAANLATCIRLAKQYARWVMVLGPYGMVPSRKARSLRPITPERLQSIGRVAQDVAAAHACRFIAFDGLLSQDHFFDDGIHPLPSGHDRIAERVWESLQASGCLGPPDTVPAWLD